VSGNQPTIWDQIAAVDAFAWDDAIHLVAGAFGGELLKNSPPLSYIVVTIYTTYQVMEFLAIHDTLLKDLAMFCAGFIAGVEIDLPAISDLIP
jgi:hypothetical protein